MYWHVSGNLVMHWHVTGNLVMYWHVSGNLVMYWHVSGNLVMYWHVSWNLVMHWHVSGNLVMHWHVSGNLVMQWQPMVQFRGRSKISGKGVRMYKGVGVRSADFISFFFNIPWKWNNLVSLRPNYFIFIGFLKTGVREGVTLLDPPLQFPSKNFTEVLLCILHVLLFRL